MTKRMLWIWMLALVLGPAAAAVGEDVARMDPDALMARLGDPDTVVLDTRAGSDWDSAAFKIKGALRADPKTFDEWSAGLDPNRTIVLYCA